MGAGFNFTNLPEALQQLIDAIKALKPIGLNINYHFNMDGEPSDEEFDTFEILFLEQNNFDNVEFVLKDMETNNSNNQNFYSLIKYMLDEHKIDNVVSKMIIEYAFKNAEKTDNYDFIGLFAERDITIPLYMKTRNQDLLEFILENLDGFDKNQFSEEFMDIVVKHVGRDEYFDMTLFPELVPNQTISSKQMNNRIQRNALVAKKYDDAVKRRVTDVSAGFGYQGIPSLQLQAIIDETVDTSGMTAYKVDKIIDKFNIWKTDTTMRIGENEDLFNSHFQDAQDDLIEI
jgi:hypothetical protein